jgi:two-component system, chemotaxis family, protein-glutamate methylesterase/glutaminase
MIKVLIVDDSRTARAALRAILERDSDIFIVGEATNSEQAINIIRRYDPDFITMDVYLEHENGLDLTKTIMRKAPRPILIITGVSPNDPELAYKAIERGALDVFPKPPAPSHPDYQKQAGLLIRLVKNLSKVPVLQSRRKKTVHPPLFETQLEQPKPTTSHQGKENDLLLIGASTGGPPVISGVLERIPTPCPAPIVVVQHITRGFAKGFSDWLSQATGHQTTVVDRAKMLEAGTVYIAADDTNLEFTSSKTICPVSTKKHKGPTPNIDTLFISAAQYSRAHIIALVLTGMGSDGTEGLLKLYDAGATTAVQAPETCAVDSMPRSALARGGAKRRLTPDEIVAFLTHRLG